jgi:MFS family permease
MSRTVGLGRAGRAIGRIALLALVLAASAIAAGDPFTLLSVAISCSVGAFLIDRRPRNSVGWLVFAIGVTSLATTTSVDLDLAALKAGTAPWPQFLSLWLGAWSGGMNFVCYAAVAFVFPSGSLVQRHRRLILVALVSAAVVVFTPALLPWLPFQNADGVTVARIPNLLSPFGANVTAEGPAAIPVFVTLYPMLVLAAGVIDLLRRYRRAVGIERLQIRWLLTAVAFVITAVFYGLAVFVIVGPHAALVAWLPALIAYPTVAIAIGVAVLRYRLYDIDRIVSRTLSWALVTGVIVAIFATLVLGLQAVLVNVTQAGTVAVALSTLIAAALFQPLRSRIQRAVDRRFDRARYDGQRTATAFADRVRTGVDLDALVDDLTTTADHAVRPATASLWLLHRSDRSEGRP